MKKINTIGIALVGMMFSVASMQAAEPPATSAPKTEWQNITADLVKATGLDKRKEEGKDAKGNARLGAVYMTRFQGMLVLPNGEVLVTSNDKGMWHSTDQGATWAKYGEPWMKGVAQSSLSLKMYYPDRIGLTLDGPVAVSSDLGKSWVKVKRPNVMITKKDSTQVQSDVTVFAADMDLSVNTPVKTILGFLHHGEMVGGMFVHTSDGGATWDWSGPLLKDTRRWMRTGVANATTLLRGEEPAKGDLPQPGILRSTDFGQTWTKVGDYTLHGTCPVHYGPNIYWAAKEGVVISRDSGKTWSVCGSPVANIVFGPYFVSVAESSAG